MYPDDTLILEFYLFHALVDFVDFEFKDYLNFSFTANVTDIK